MLKVNFLPNMKKIFTQRIKLPPSVIAISIILILSISIGSWMLFKENIHQKKSQLTPPANPQSPQHKIDSDGKDTPDKMDYNFNKTPLRDAIQKLATLSDLNIIINNAVQGEITMHIKGLPPERALDLLAQTHHLSQQKIGETVYITPLSEIQNTPTKPLDLEIKLIHVNYADPEAIAKVLKNKDSSLLSKDATVLVDKRTNSLLIKEIPDQLSNIRTIIKQLDIPTPQVSIEARIVSIDNDYEKELGVKFGLTSGKHISGSLTGANELAAGNQPTNIPIKDRLNVDLPVINDSAGRIGLALFKLRKGTLLDLELSALESEGHAEIISTPRLVTTNQYPATIEAGEEIPYQESVAQGVTATAFKKATLRLEITPQITPDKKIILHIKANQDKRGSTEINGVPTVDTHQVSTQIRIDNTQTVVLGGIYEHTKTKAIERIPFFGELPVIGALFRNQKTINHRRELLIFVTPKIIPS